jgi:peptide/nickel transport system substrate-binding protein
MTTEKLSQLELTLTSTRREFLKRAMAVGLSVPIAGALLAACETDSDDEDEDEGVGDTDDEVATDDEDADTDEEESETEEEEPDEEDEAADDETEDADEPSDAVEGQILQFGMNAADLGTLDPHNASSTNDRTAVDLIFNALVRYKPGDSNEIEPDLATEIPEPEESDAGQVWRFQIQEGIMTHPHPDVDSYEITADDVIFSLERSANPDSSAYAGEYEGMTFEKVDDYTVEITLEQPLSEALFLPKVADYAGGFIVPQQAVEAIGAEAFSTNPVGTGPFRFESYSSQDRIRLVAFADYFRGAPQLGGVDLRFVPDTSSRELALQSGELHVINGPADTIWVDRVNEIDGITVDVFGVGEVTFLNFNMNVEPFDDVRVRQAVAYAIDRDEHLALFGGEPVAQNVYSLVPEPLLDGGLSQEEAEEMDLAFDYDPDRARELLEEAGYGDGFTLELIASESESYLLNYESMQAELAQIGIDIELQVVDHSTMHEQIREDVNPIVIYIAWRPNQDVFLTRFAHSSTRVVEGESPDTNFSHYTGIDDLIEEARNETDLDRQTELWKEANAQILEDMAIYPLHFLNQVYARSDAVDYGHELVSVMALSPQITEATTLNE